MPAQLEGGRAMKKLGENRAGGSKTGYRTLQANPDHPKTVSVAGSEV